MRLLLAFLLFTSQDPDLLERLNDDDLETRRVASTELVKLGPSVIPKLQSLDTSANPELQDTVAYIIAEIENNEKIKTFFNPTPRLTQEFTDKSADEIAASIRKMGVTVNVWGGERKLSLKFDNVTPFQAADQLARALGMRYVFNYGDISILDDELKDGHFNYHTDGISIQMQELNIVKRLVSKLSGASFIIDVHIDPKIKPSKTPTIIITSIEDEAGNKLEHGGSARYKGDMVSTVVVQCDGLKRTAKKIIINGTVELDFALVTQEVVIETPFDGKVYDGRHFNMVVVHHRQGYTKLSVNRKDGRPFSLEKAILHNSIVIHTPNAVVGEQYAMVAGYDNSITAGIIFETMKFTLVNEYWTKSIPFRFEADIP